MKGKGRHREGDKERIRGKGKELKVKKESWVSNKEGEKMGGG